MKKAYTLRDSDGSFYADGGLGTTPEISHAMRFGTEAEAARVNKNLFDRFNSSFDLTLVAGEELGMHGTRWHVDTCELCGRFSGEMEDPTFDASRVLSGGRALWICELCAKSQIESEMMRLGVVVN